jgi:hypothetical protein
MNTKLNLKKKIVVKLTKETGSKNAFGRTTTGTVSETVSGTIVFNH